jgi:hypothetical protein
MLPDQTTNGNILARIVRKFFSKITQNPEFYNIRYYKKQRNRFRKNPLMFYHYPQCGK